MALSIQLARDVLENLFLSTSTNKNLTLKNGEYFYRPLEKSNEILCKKVNEDASLDELIYSFKHHEAVVLIDKNNYPLTCITAEQMIEFLHSSYNQLKAFYETVIQTTDASVTVIDAKEFVRTWTKGAEKIFSVKNKKLSANR